MSSIEEVKTELVLAEQVTLPGLAAMAINVAEEVDMVRMGLERLTAGSSNGELAKMLAELVEAHQAVIGGMSHINQAGTYAAAALTEM